MPFREVQRFGENRLARLAIIGTSALLLAGAALIAGNEGLTSPGVTVLVLYVVIAVASPALLRYVRLETVVDAMSLRVRFTGTRGIAVEGAEIASSEAVTYRPIREFGGWGYRIGGRGKRAYNVSGTRGVRVHLVDGREYLIGSARPDELASAIATLRGSGPAGG